MNIVSREIFLSGVVNIVGCHYTDIDTIRWKGNVDNKWDINASPNWVLNSNGATPATYLQPTAPGDSVTFDDTAAGNFNNC